MGTGEITAGGTPAMDKHPIQGKGEGGEGVEHFQSLHATKTGISSGSDLMAP